MQVIDYSAMCNEEIDVELKTMCDAQRITIMGDPTGQCAVWLADWEARALFTVWRARRQAAEAR